MVKQYLIFRHGLTAAVRDNIPYGDTVLTAEILPEATPSIKKLADFLKDIYSDFNVSSELQRCKQTVKIIEEITGKSFQFDQRLNEPFDKSFQQLEEQVSEFINDLNNSGYQIVMICTHGATISALKQLLLTGKFEPSQLYDYPQPGELLIIEDGSFQKLNFNLNA